MTIRCRAATVDDVDGIVEVFRACWSTSYAAVLRPALVASMTAERADQLWISVFNEAAPGEVLVATEATDGRVVGVTRWAVGGGTGWVHSLYVSPSVQGHGLGTQLLASAEAALATHGVSVARLWVFRDNAPSTAFYRCHGWLPDGTTRVEDEFGEPEIGLTKGLTLR